MYQVRDGKQVVPTCKECGCRLTQFEDMWYHYYGDTERDAKHHKCSLYYTFLKIGPKVLDNEASYSVV